MINNEVLAFNSAAKLVTLEEVILRSSVELHLLTNISLAEAEDIQAQASKLLYPLTHCTGELEITI